MLSSRPSGCFPMAPYSNRLGYRHFRWLGRDHTTAPNFDDGNPHSLHGTVWRQPWRVTSASATHAELAVTQLANEHWPFNFDATQRFELERQRADDAPGAHQHRRRARSRWAWAGTRTSRSAAAAACMSSAASAGSPTRARTCRRAAWPQDSIDGEVRHLDFDNCFEGWRGAARVRDEEAGVEADLVVAVPGGVHAARRATTSASSRSAMSAMRSRWPTRPRTASSRWPRRHDGRVDDDRGREVTTPKRLRRSPSRGRAGGPAKPAPRPRARHATAP